MNTNSYVQKLQQAKEQKFSRISAHKDFIQIAQSSHYLTNNPSVSLQRKAGPDAKWPDSPWKHTNPKYFHLQPS